MTENLKELIVVDGMVEAEIIKAKLSSFNIPCILKYESAGRIFGITMNGLGKVKISVPVEFYKQARELVGTINSEE